MKKQKRKETKRESNYAKCWVYLKESKCYFFFILSLFLIAVLIGFFFPVLFVDAITNMIRQLFDRVKDMNFPELLGFIIWNNISVSFIGMVLGVGLGLIPIILALFNGYVLGFVSSKAAESAGNLTLLRLLPHGIFELPALIISLGLGLKLGMGLLQKNGEKKLKENFYNSLRVFFYVVIPLLIIAGIIETFFLFFVG